MPVYKERPVGQWVDQLANKVCTLRVGDNEPAVFPFSRAENTTSAYKSPFVQSKNPVYANKHVHGV